MNHPTPAGRTRPRRGVLAVAIAQTAYDLVANNPASTASDLATAVIAYNAALLSAIASVLTTEAGATAAHGGDCEGEAGRVRTTRPYSDRTFP